MKKNKIKTALTIGAVSITALHLLNQVIFANATAEGTTASQQRRTFHWKLGNINYIKSGHGSPLLLIHDLNNYSSTYEWSRCIAALNTDHTIYALDLLGCGYSDKPAIIYTAYMYTQLIRDFIKDIIGEPASIVATGTSASLAVMTSTLSPEYCDRLILVNPENPDQAALIPGTAGHCRRLLLTLPVIGTSLYNFFMQKATMRSLLCGRLFNKPSLVPNDFSSAFYENAHLFGSTAKYLYASQVSHYTGMTLKKAISTQTRLFIVYGENEPGIDRSLRRYKKANTNLYSICIKDTKRLPQIEKAKAFSSAVNTLLQ